MSVEGAAHTPPLLPRLCRCCLSRNPVGATATLPLFSLMYGCLSPASDGAYPLPAPFPGLRRLIRIDIDGKRGFSFGVDEAWAPREHPSSHPDGTEGSDAADMKKRVDFHDKQDWSLLQQVRGRARRVC